MKERFAELSYPDAPKIIVTPPGSESRKLLALEEEYVPQ